MRDRSGYNQVIKTVQIRPLPKSKFSTFGNILGNESWSYLDNPLDPSTLVELFEQHLLRVSDIVFPTKLVKIHQNDKPYFTEELRTLKRLKLREYVKHGKSQKLNILHENYANILASQIKKYKEKLIQEVKDGKKGSIYKHVRRLGNGPADTQGKSFTIPSFVEQQLSPLQSAQCISDFFTEISREFRPLSLDNLSLKVYNFLTNKQTEQIPFLTEHYKEFKRKIIFPKYHLI